MEVVARSVTVKEQGKRDRSARTNRLVTAYRSNMNFAVYHIRNNIDADVSMRVAIVHDDTHRLSR